MVPTHYPSTSCGLTPIADMHDAHLANALAALGRKRSADPAMLLALNAEQSRRAAKAAPAIRNI